MKGMNFEEWQALMRTQRNGGTSSEIHNHEAVISNKNPNSESGNAAADEYRAKQRYHNEQSKGMATDRKEEVASEQVLWAKLADGTYQVATYNGKVVVANPTSDNPAACSSATEILVPMVTEHATWSMITPGGPPLDRIVFDDGTEITADAIIDADDVPVNAEMAFTELYAFKYNN